MNIKKLYERIIIRTLIVLLAIFFIINLAVPLFDALMPVILAFFLCLIIAPLINKIDDALPIKHKSVSYIVGTVILIIFLIIFLWAFQILIYQVNGLVTNIITNWNEIVKSTNELMAKINSEINLMPTFVHNAIQAGLKSALEFFENLQANAIKITLNFTSAFINTSSNAIFFTITFIVAFYIILGEMKKAAFKYTQVVADSSRDNISLVRKVFKNSTWNYVKAQLKLALLCTILMLIALKIIGQQFFIPIAILIGIVDLLPMIGPVIVMIPWAILEVLIFTNPQKGVAILIILAIWSGIRQVLAPKVIGSSADIHPLLSVIALYAGLRLFGVLGAIFMPVLMIFIVGLIRSGILDNWIHDYKEFYDYIRNLLNIGKRNIKVPED